MSQVLPILNCTKKPSTDIRIVYCPTFIPQVASYSNKICQMGILEDTQIKF